MNGRLTTILVAATGLGVAGLGFAWTTMNQPGDTRAAALEEGTPRKLAAAQERVKMRAAPRAHEPEEGTSAKTKQKSEPPMQDDPEVTMEVNARELGASDWMAERYQVAYLHTGPVRDTTPTDEHEALARSGTPASLIRQEENLLREHPELRATIERNRAERQVLVEKGEQVPPGDL